MSFLTMTGSFYHFQYYEITDRFPFLSVHIGPVNLFSSFDHADFIHSADLLQMAHRLCLCRVLKIQKCVGVFVAALVLSLIHIWQNTQRSVQPEKKTVPLPVVPLMHGSSHICKAALAARSSCPAPQKPVDTVRST